MNASNNTDFNQLAAEIKQLGKEMGFDQVGITDLDLSSEFKYLEKWLAQGFHGEMKYLTRRIDPATLFPGAKRAICFALHFHPSKSSDNPIAAFAQYQDYPRFIKGLLEKHVKKIMNKIKGLQKMEVFSGSSPFMEKALAAKSGIGWMGKNTLIYTPTSGSRILLGIVITDLPLPVDKPLASRCGDCNLCVKSCPTGALVAPYQIDARRCISYLTAEHRGAIPVEMRPLIGRKIYGCDQCQNACPLNKINELQSLFKPFSQFADGDLKAMLLWDEKTFLTNTENSPIRRLGYERWRRNLAVAIEF